jgi:hypothetical protein
MPWQQPTMSIRIINSGSIVTNTFIRRSRWFSGMRSSRRNLVEQTALLPLLPPHHRAPPLLSINQTPESRFAGLLKPPFSTASTHSGRRARGSYCLDGAALAYDHERRPVGRMRLYAALLDSVAMARQALQQRRVAGLDGIPPEAPDGSR